MELFLFPHSHFCEKAKWALDYKNISYQPTPIIPGIHILTLRKFKKGTSVPVLLDGKTAIRGSGEIISYLDQKFPDKMLRPEDPILYEKSLAFEAEMDRSLGKSIRAILYDHLLKYPDFIRYCFMYPLPSYKHLIFRMGYPLLKSIVNKSYVRSDEYLEKSRFHFQKAIEKINTIVEKQDYLLTSQFSRADLTVASHLAFIAMPEEHPFPWIEIPDEAVKNFYAEYQDQPAVLWAKEIYKKHRGESLSLLKK